MTTRTAAFLAAIALTVSLPTIGASAAPGHQEKKGDQKAASGVAGRWTMSVKGSPHGDLTMGLQLTQDGKKVSGIFATPHGDDINVVGEFIDGTLTLATPGGGESRISMTAKLKGDGTLDGYLSSQMGDMTWSAKRATDK